MPPAVATAVAQGKLPLNEALEQLAQSVEIERLIKTYELSRALATQVVLGHADLESFLIRRRFEEHRKKHAQRSILDEAAAHGRVMAFLLFGGERVEARVGVVSPYEVELLEEGKPPRTVHKLELKLAYEAEAWKKVKKSVTKDRALAEAGRRPARLPQERFGCSDRRLFDWMIEGKEVEVTTLEGDVVHGEIQWVGRYEFGLSVKGEAGVVVFRHAIHRIQAAG